MSRKSLALILCSILAGVFTVLAVALLVLDHNWCLGTLFVVLAAGCYYVVIEIRRPGGWI